MRKSSLLDSAKNSGVGSAGRRHTAVDNQMLMKAAASPLASMLKELVDDDSNDEKEDSETEEHPVVDLSILIIVQVHRRQLR